MWRPTVSKAEGRVEVVGFALKGLGSAFIEELVRSERVRVKHIYTRKEPYDFIYYDCEDVETLCARHGIPWSYIPETGSWDVVPAELGIIGSFHRILRAEHLRNFKTVVNIHPSLLPAHRGRTPTVWTVMNGETITGVSAHLVNEQIDDGRLILQESLLNPHLSDADLRRALAFFQRKLIRRLLEEYPDFAAVESGAAHSYDPVRDPKAAVLDFDKIPDVESLVRHIKAWTNFPMPRIRTAAGRIFIIDYDQPQDTLEVETEGRKFNLLGRWES